MSTFGPTFGDELRAAGLGGLPLVWQDDGTIRGRETLTPAQSTALDGVIAAHNPLSKTAYVLREESFNADVDWQDIVSRLAAATPAQIKTYVTSNVTDLASARTLLMKILLLVAMLIRR